MTWAIALMEVGVRLVELIFAQYAKGAKRDAVRLVDAAGNDLLSFDVREALWRQWVLEKKRRQLRARPRKEP